MAAKVVLSSDANEFHRNFETDARGQHTARDLPFGVYRLVVTHSGFAAQDRLIEIRSEVPVRVLISMMVAPVATRVEVNDAATLLSPHQSSNIYSDGQQAVQERMASAPGRALFDLVNAQPGWLYEANGVLHPRGSEYDVQFVKDGFPLTENRSPAFAAPFDEDDVESLRTRAGGYPAEFGRKLGGVVEITTKSEVLSGWRGQARVGGGSFATATGEVGLSYGRGANQFVGNLSGGLTDRYLDPPVLNNYTNHGSLGDFYFSYARQLTREDHLRISLEHNSVSSQVPNELVQQETGQRQGRRNGETGGDVNYTRVLSPDLLLSVAGSVRDTGASLTSNAESTPILAAQQRGFREDYARMDLAGQFGRHSWKIGADGLFSHVYEALQYQITDPSAFSPTVAPNFQFTDRRHDREQSSFAQDQIQLGNWNVSGGIRFDHYHFVVGQSAWSSRVAASRYFPRIGLVARVSYDRIFQTPAIENLLLASSPQVDQLSDAVIRVPIPPAKGNFYEIGFTQAIAGKLSLTGNAFRREWRDFSDDNVLLNTGISFPISFSRAWIKGIEAKLTVQSLGNFSGFVSYSNQVAVGQGPITGGLFFGAEAQDALTDNGRFPVSQDQRNTVRARLRAQLTSRGWLALQYSFGSGLPVEAEGGNLDLSFLLAQYGAQILNRVDFAAGRVRPSFSLDLGGGVQLYQREHKSISFLAQISNLTNRVNVINFASLFSGTAVAPKRAVTVRLKTEF